MIAFEQKKAPKSEVKETELWTFQCLHFYFITKYSKQSKCEHLLDLLEISQV